MTGPGYAGPEAVPLSGRPSHLGPQGTVPQATSAPRRLSLVRILAIGFGVVLALGIVSALSGGGSHGDGFSGTGTTGSSGGSGGRSQIYDGGSVTTTDTGELIYSDDSGNSFSTGG